MNKKDFMLLLGILFLGAVAFLAMKYGTGKKGDLVVISVNGSAYGTYALTENQRIEINQASGKNTVVIQDGEVFMESADCPDKYCVKHAKISAVHESIVCLPHKLVVEIQGKKEGSKEEMDVITQ